MSRWRGTGGGGRRKRERKRASTQERERARNIDKVRAHMHTRQKARESARARARLDPNHACYSCLLFPSQNTLPSTPYTHTDAHIHTKRSCDRGKKGTGKATHNIHFLSLASLHLSLTQASSENVKFQKRHQGESGGDRVGARDRRPNR